MKKVICLLIILLLTGCSLFKRDNMENIDIITTNYAIEYVTRYLYGDNSLVSSIYPDGVDITNYKFTEKQIKDYSKKDLFIYMGNTSDSDQAVTFLNNNNDIKIIDATYGMQYKYATDELWLNPSNLLMIAGNIKNGLDEYITSTYLLKNIDNLYEELKVELSDLDADYKTTIANANYKTIVVNSDNLLYLEKYDLNVISLDKNNQSYEKNLALFKNYLKQQTIKYFYAYENAETTEEISQIITDNSVETLNIKNLKNITDEERDGYFTYTKIMYNNLEEFKKELYKNI
ncbi:MAG: zinc ABC transporter substrate-binding protein [Bacilli bacterium]|nr:zinc ABC transporter substrate-binding protein [Bacilli bacterium]